MSGLLEAREQLSAPLRRLRQVRGTWLLARVLLVQRLRELHWLVHRVREGGGPEEDQYPAIDHAEGLARGRRERLLRGAVTFYGEPVAPCLNTPPVAPRLKKEKGVAFACVCLGTPLRLYAFVFVFVCVNVSPRKKHSRIRDSAFGLLWVYVFVCMSHVSV